MQCVIQDKDKKIWEGLKKSTKEKFSFAWDKFAEKEVAKGWYKDSFSYLEYIPDEVFKGKGKLG